MKPNEPSTDPPRRNRAVFALLMMMAITGTAAMSPALAFLIDPARQSPFSEGVTAPAPFLIAFATSNIILCAVAMGIGLRLESIVGMGVPQLRSWLVRNVDDSYPRRASLTYCFAMGLGLATVVIATGFAFRGQLPDLPEGFVFPPIWQGVLMMLGAAIREEILFRFFALNLIVWIATKVRGEQQPTSGTFWLINVLVAFIFAVMHLIPASLVIDLNTITLSLGIALVTAAGVVFGHVYRQHGLMMAMFTHAVSSLLIYLGVRGSIAILAS